MSNMDLRCFYLLISVVHPVSTCRYNLAHLPRHPRFLMGIYKYKFSGHIKNYSKSSMVLSAELLRIELISKQCGAW